MIDERMEEQASLYVLVLLAGSELAEFETQLRDDSDLRRLVEQFRASTDLLAASVPQVQPSSHLKQKIFQQLDARESVTSKIVPMPRETYSGFIVWFPWALAACLAVICGFLFLDKTKKQTAAGKYAHNLKSELSQLHEQTAELRAQTDSLQTEVATLQKKDHLSQMRIATLSSLLEDSPKAVAVSVWDNEQQKGILVVENLAAIPADKDYQLWVIDSKYPSPVDAGVFTVDAKGAVRFQYQPKSRVNFEKIAVTLERKGGVAKPEGKMVLLGT
ncbi:MAG: anti-sigma factor [Verrucomicrobiota bacterium]